MKLAEPIRRDDALLFAFDDLDDDQALAQWYADLWDLLMDNGISVPDAELEAAEKELADTDWQIVWDDGFEVVERGQAKHFAREKVKRKPYTNPQTGRKGTISEGGQIRYTEPPPKKKPKAKGKRPPAKKATSAAVKVAEKPAKAIKEKLGANVTERLNQMMDNLEEAIADAPPELQEQVRDRLAGLMARLGKPDAEKAWQVGYDVIKELENADKRLGGIVKIPDVADAMKAKLGLTPEQTKELLQQWQKEDKLILQVTNDPDVEPRADEGLQSNRGLLFYVKIRQGEQPPAKEAKTPSGGLTLENPRPGKMGEGWTADNLKAGDEVVYIGPDRPFTGVKSGDKFKVQDIAKSGGGLMIYTGNGPALPPEFFKKPDTEGAPPAKPVPTKPQMATPLKPALSKTGKEIAGNIDNFSFADIQDFVGKIGKLPPAEARQVAKDVTGAVGASDSRAKVVRDLKAWLDSIKLTREQSKFTLEPSMKPKMAAPLKPAAKPDRMPDSEKAASQPLPRS